MMLVAFTGEAKATNTGSEHCGSTQLGCDLSSSDDDRLRCYSAVKRMSIRASRDPRLAQSPTRERSSSALPVAAPSVVLSKMHQTVRPAVASSWSRVPRAARYSSEYAE